MRKRWPLSKLEPHVVDQRDSWEQWCELMLEEAP
jgi:hypothetical protein